MSGFNPREHESLPPSAELHRVLSDMTSDVFAIAVGRIKDGLGKTVVGDNLWVNFKDAPRLPLQLGDIDAIELESVSMTPSDCDRGTARREEMNADYANARIRVYRQDEGFVLEGDEPYTDNTYDIVSLGGEIPPFLAHSSYGIFDQDCYMDYVDGVAEGQFPLVPSLDEESCRRLIDWLRSATIEDWLDIEKMAEWQAS